MVVCGELGSFFTLRCLGRQLSRRGSGLRNWGRRRGGKERGRRGGGGDWRRGEGEAGTFMNKQVLNKI